MARKRKQKTRNATTDRLAGEFSERCQVSSEPNPASPPPPPPPLPPPPPSPPPPPPSPVPPSPSRGIISLDKNINAELLAKWPKLKLKIPPIFLHQPTDFGQHVKKLLQMRIKFYQPHLSKNYTKITCENKNDYRRMFQYFEERNLPFHTFGDPLKRKMKVVIRGLPKDTDLDKVKNAFKSVSIPIIRVHKMYTKVERKDKTILVLAVVPYDDEGKAILKVTHIFGHKVVLEPPFVKPRQCHRCQKWGHSQRYCQGTVACVKCAGEHFTKFCERKPPGGEEEEEEEVEEEPPKCANCGKDHTANYRDCIAAPGSIQYQILYDTKSDKEPCHKPILLVTKDNYHKLYKNVDYNKPKPGAFPRDSDINF